MLLVVALISGCATPSNSRDPFEPVNRKVYRFNEGVDKAVLRPAARVYRAVLPSFVRTGVRNVFWNVGDVRVMFNNALQGKFATAYSDFGRIAINSTLGVLGLFDIASEAGIEKHNEDFGQTLGWWGVGPGPFLILPVLGPSTGRDAAGLLVDYTTDPTAYIDPSGARYAISGTRVVNGRSELLDASNVLHNAALDEYQFVRDAYLQRRRSLIFDGNPPPEKEDEFPLTPPATQVPSREDVKK